MKPRLGDDTVQELKRWFSEYCSSFSTSIMEDQRNFNSKEEHTHQVCLNAVRIAEDQTPDRQMVRFAEVVALFHDIGRFAQYQQYKTFNDTISINHAGLGAKVLLDNNVLRVLSKHDRDMVIHAVTLHNVFALPEGLDDETLLHARIIRDADKLDIMRVVLDYFSQDHGDRAEAVSLGLPDLPGCSAPVLAALSRGEMARKSEMRNQNDFKLLQLAWIYDLNFTCSLRMIRDRGIIDRIAALLPGDGEIGGAVDRVREYVFLRSKGT